MKSLIVDILIILPLRPCLWPIVLQKLSKFDKKDFVFGRLMVFQIVDLKHHFVVVQKYSYQSWKV